MSQKQKKFFFEGHRGGTWHEARWQWRACFKLAIALEMQSQPIRSPFSATCVALVVFSQNFETTYKHSSTTIALSTLRRELLSFLPLPSEWFVPRRTHVHAPLPPLPAPHTAQITSPRSRVKLKRFAHASSAQYLMCRRSPHHTVIRACGLRPCRCHMHSV